MAMWILERREQLLHSVHRANSFKKLYSISKRDPVNPKGFYKFVSSSCNCRIEKGPQTKYKYCQKPLTKIVLIFLKEKKKLISMASAKLQKPNSEACSKAHEEHRFSHKISEMTAWGSKVLGHKHQEHQALTKHCNTCQCVAPKDMKPTVTETNKKEHATTVSRKDAKFDACKDTNKQKGEPAGTVNKNAKHSTCLELKRKEKQHATRTATKDPKQAPSSEIKKKEMNEQREKSNTTEASNTITKKEHKGEPTNHWFSSMADHWKDRIKMMGTKDDKSKDSSSSSSSDSEDEALEKKKACIQ